MKMGRHMCHLGSAGTCLLPALMKIKRDLGRTKHCIFGVLLLYWIIDSNSFVWVRWGVVVTRGFVSLCLRSSTYELWNK